MILRISLLFIFFQFSSFAQQVQFSVDETSSYIEYEGKHLLHDWSGINKKIKGVIISDESSGKFRSEERRVGRECRSRWSPYH